MSRATQAEGVYGVCVRDCTSGCVCLGLYAQMKPSFLSLPGGLRSDRLRDVKELLAARSGIVQELRRGGN